MSFLGLEAEKKLAIAIYLTNHTNDYVYATWPTTNVEGEDNISGSENDTFYQFTIIEDQQPNQNN